MPELLVSGWLLLDAVLFFGWVTVYPLDIPLRWLLLPFALGQFIALSGWIVLGSRKVTVTGIGLLAILVLVMADNLSHDALALLAGIGVSLYIALYGLLLNVPLIVARSRGWLFAMAPKTSPKTGAKEPPFYQTSLREMFFDTVLVAVLAALWAATRPDSPRQPGAAGSSWPDAATVMLITFVIPWSIWACLWWTRPFRGGWVAALITAAWGVVLARVLGRSFGDLLFALVPAGVLTFHVMALQVAGFRLTKDEVDYLENSEP